MTHRFQYLIPGFRKVCAICAKPDNHPNHDTNPQHPLTNTTRHPERGSRNPQRKGTTMTTDNTNQLLREARQLIAEPDHWIQGTFWRDAYGGIEGTPAKFCAIGALQQAAVKLHYDATPSGVAPLYEAERTLLAALQLVSPPRIIGRNFIGSRPVVVSTSVVEWNDLHETRHEDVLRLFDTAITLTDSPPKAYDWTHDPGIPESENVVDPGIPESENVPVLVDA